MSRPRRLTGRVIAAGRAWSEESAVNYVLDRIPLIALFILSIVMVLAAIRVGVYVGMRHRSRGEPEGPIGSAVGAMLGLLAFILAFTFGIAGTRFDARRQLLLQETNAIGTAALRAQLLPEPHRGELRSLFKRYVDARVDAVREDADVPKILADSAALQTEMWSHAVALMSTDFDPPVRALFIAALNDVFDVHTLRATVALQYRIPMFIWLGVFVVTVVSMAAVGFQFGLAGRISLPIHVGLAIAFSAVALLIVDLDRATGGMLRVSQQPMIELQAWLAGASP